MSEILKKYDREFRDGAVRIVEETGKPIAQVPVGGSLDRSAKGPYGDTRRSYTSRQDGASGG